MISIHWDSIDELQILIKDKQIIEADLLFINLKAWQKQYQS